ncbi:uncharacterized protein N7503_000977 [Penicillium pulvis]|uniref:uncharacterized protein n=1 Tax=Penicillium pulvis TaxID=1562058 RepID=UPI002547CDFC|nr:uncharacterized protein N7503_000977 [Penicillium pulvis]KAJ5814227.1 hypothetical protein N7503_000977 [Penicillium pulvis]
MNGHTSIPSRQFQPASLQLNDLKQICSRTVDTSTYPLACAVERNIPIYDLGALETGAIISQLQDEWHHVLHTGPGVFVLRDMYNPARYSHNSFNKHGAEDPASFVDYYANLWLAAVCTAWLGPGYKVTAQVNAVHPGGAAQGAHRDFHLGFQEADACARFPAPTQLATQFLTLQGAVAHTDMPVENGPTRQDGVFFNPALFHAAGANVMDPNNGGFRRVANLLQVSSPFGKPMETVDSLPLVENTWELLVQRYQTAGKHIADPDLDPQRSSLEAREIRAFIQAVAEGYPFPTNLDRRPPAPSGMAPESEQAIVLRGLEAGWSRKEVVAALEKLRHDERA